MAPDRRALVPHMDLLFKNILMLTICISTVCNSPSVPTNGQVSVSQDFTTATYSCDTGYTLNGVLTRLCGNDGSGWSDQQPSCGNLSFIFLLYKRF